MDAIPKTKRRVGIIGFGKIGMYLVDKILASDNLELAFVWNRNAETAQTKVDGCYILEDLNDCQSRKPDLVVEVAHPSITKEFGARILLFADYMIGSPSALADDELFMNLKQAATHHAVYIPSGALWGGEDIRKMADSGTLQALKVMMTFHPESLKLEGSLKEKNDLVKERTVLYDGCVRDICPMASNNVNTMAAAAIAGHNLGFSDVQCTLLSDPDVGNWHIVQIDTWGAGNIVTGNAFHVQTLRKNPAQIGAVTGSATLLTFFASLQCAHGQPNGIHLC